MIAGPGASLLVVACRCAPSDRVSLLMSNQKQFHIPASTFGCSFTSSDAGICLCPSSIAAVHASTFDNCQIGLALLPFYTFNQQCLYFLRALLQVCLLWVLTAKPSPHRRCCMRGICCVRLEMRFFPLQNRVTIIHNHPRCAQGKPS